MGIETKIIDQATFQKMGEDIELTLEKHPGKGYRLHIVHKRGIEITTDQYNDRDPLDAYDRLVRFYGQDY